MPGKVKIWIGNMQMIERRQPTEGGVVVAVLPAVLSGIHGGLQVTQLYKQLKVFAVQDFYFSPNDPMM